jgi:hypothetical protein
MEIPELSLEREESCSGEEPGTIRCTECRHLFGACRERVCGAGWWKPGEVVGCAGGHCKHRSCWVLRDALGVWFHPKGSYMGLGQRQAEREQKKQKSPEDRHSTISGCVLPNIQLPKQH